MSTGFHAARATIGEEFHRRGMLYVAAVGVIVFIVWMTIGAYQSHYVAALRTLGDTTTKSLTGAPKEGRGDEWSTYLPILKQAYLEGFPARSDLKPYFERLEWFIAIPHLNASLVFLPNYLLYWLVPGGKALSFQGFYYNALFIVSVVWLLCNLGVRRRYAFCCAFMLLFSQFYQVWWTSNFPALGASILPFAVFTSRLRPSHKFLLLAWSFGHVLFGEMYPPFYLSIALAVVPLVLVARPDLFTAKSIALAALAGAMAFACYLGLKWDYFQLVSHTSYPGLRVNTGGGETIRSLLGVIFPTLGTNAPSGVLDNLYSLAVAGTVLPLVFIAIGPSMRWTRRDVWITVTFAVVAAFMVWYMVVGVPRAVAEFTPLRMIPGRRMVIGLSLLVALYSTIMISRHEDAFRPIAILVVAFFYAVISILIRPSVDFTGNFFAISYYPLAFTVFAAIAALGGFAFRKVDGVERIGLISVLAGMCVVSVIVYGSFNPVMRARDILRPVHSQLVNDWNALYRYNNDRPFGTIGHYGDVLRGENLPALEAIHLVNVNPKMYEKVFPTLSSTEIHDLFNQFRGIAFANVPAMDAGGATVVFPVKPYTVSFPNEVVEGAPLKGDTAALAASAVTVSDVVDRGGSYVVFWGASLAAPLPIRDVLQLRADCQVRHSWLTRYPVVIPGAPVVPVALQGLAGQLTVAAASPDAARQCAQSLQFGIARR